MSRRISIKLHEATQEFLLRQLVQADDEVLRAFEDLSAKQEYVRDSEKRVQALKAALSALDHLNYE